MSKNLEVRVKPKPSDKCFSRQIGTSVAYLPEETLDGLKVKAAFVKVGKALCKQFGLPAVEIVGVDFIRINE
ncbi:hypothetical protein [Methylobacter sp.]|uniref:hypothetical protein n=1 Tax=Methylobacter sp. TaxID=2051955 RepID=UPI001221D4EE|nr:hypothetical protein [Methylobacter sp.]TAK59478.1 MAG: hypothetical protein EPO18_20155 [Methylobacter sp.]